MARPTRVSTWLIAFAAAASALGFSEPCRAATVTVDSATQYQSMNGWEVSLSGLLEIDVASDPGGAYDPSLNSSVGATVISKLVNDLGVNRVRLELSSGAENPVDYFAKWQSGDMDYGEMEAHFYEKINDNDDPSTANAGGFQFGLLDFKVETELLPIKDAVEANGEQLYVNLNYVDFAGKPLQGSLHHGGNSSEYAELMLVTFQHLKDKYDITPDAVEIILEPENTNDWKSGTSIGQAIVATKTRLAAAGFTPTFIAPSVTNASNAVPYFNDIAKVTGAVGDMSMLAYHRYVGGDYAGIWSAASSNGLQTGMLEYTSGNIDTLLDDLTVANVSAWQKWGLVVDTRLVSPSNRDYAYIVANFDNPETPTVGFSSGTAPMLPCFRYVRSGAVRIKTQSDDGNFKPVAFENANDTEVVVVRAGSAGSLTISGVGDATYGVKSVSFEGVISDGAAVTASSGSLTLSVPTGVTAIYDQNTPGPNSTGNGTGGAGGASGGGESGGTVGSAGTSGAGTTGGGVAASGGSAFAGGAYGAGGSAGFVASGGSFAGGTAAGGMAAGGTTGTGTSGNASGDAPAEGDNGCACALSRCFPSGGHGALALVSLLFALSSRRRQRSVLA